MPAYREGKVLEVLELTNGTVRARVECEGQEYTALGYVPMVRPPDPGDRVVLNMTGIDLGLGTGGLAFILWNLDAPNRIDLGVRGHVVKMRYTPWQIEVDAVEAPENPEHEWMRDVTSIDGLPVIACGLHSQIAGVAAGIKAKRPHAQVAYVMTDAGALPFRMSQLARELHSTGLIDLSITCGHAFGGDAEAVNVYSALAYARRADAAIVAMGPGVVGTATALGFSAIEQGQVLNAAASLGGRGVACVRVSFADDRDRHEGVSHHTLTSLSIVTLARCAVALPQLDERRASIIEDQLTAAGVDERHDIHTVDGGPGVELLASKCIAPTMMGRSIEDDPAPWLASAAAGSLAADLIDPK